MKIIKIIGLLTILFLSAAHAVHSSLVFQIDDDIVNNIMISQGDQLYGSFDINTIIPDDGLYNAPYDITLAAYNFSFRDDGEKNLQNISYSYAYTDNNRDSHYYVYHYYQDDLEGVNINIEGQPYADATNYYS